MRAVGALVAIALALALQTTLARFVVGGSTPIDLVLVAVVYVALTSGAASGMLAGSVAGLIQDALGEQHHRHRRAGEVDRGIRRRGDRAAVHRHGGHSPRLFVFMAATAVHALLFQGLYVALGLRTFSSPWAAVATQALGNTVIGMVAFAIVESFPGVMERRRMSRRPKV